MEEFIGHLRQYFAFFIFCLFFSSTLAGTLWGIIAIGKQIELGFFAIAIGALNGYITSFFTYNKISKLKYHLVSIVLSIYGFFVGKYLIYCYFHRNFFVENATKITELIKYYFQIIPYAFPDFVKDYPALVEFYDIIWILLIVFAAWKIDLINPNFKRATERKRIIRNRFER